jgi:citrate lyase subunit beta/citryl-CoA lyase
MYNRSWLEVSGEDEAALGAAARAGADAVVVDLAGSVSMRARDAARANAARWLTVHAEHITGHRPMGRWVRINAVESRMWRDDLVAVVPCAPDGVILSNASGPEEVRLVGAELYELEQRFHVPAGQIQIIPVVGGTARAALTVPEYLEAPHNRLAGIAWSAGDLAAAIGATRQRVGKAGRWSDPFALTRAQVLLTAQALGMTAIETAYDGPDDPKAVTSAVRAARADGFSGMFAREKEQVALINAAFTPSPGEVESARRVLSSAGNGAVSPDADIGGHRAEPRELVMARRVLELAEGGRADDRVPILRPA